MLTRVLAAAVGLATLAAGPTLAQDLRAVSSFAHDLEILDLGGLVVTAGTFHGVTTVVEGSEPFVEGEHLTTDCVVLAMQGADGGIRVETYCVAADLAGDELYLSALREKGDAEGGDGVWSIDGGTGRFSDLGGECTYRTQYLPGGRAAVASECEVVSRDG